MIRHTKSLLLVWRIAELEALNLKQESIRPAHFFLGILKAVEIDLGKALKNQREEVFDEIKQDIADLKGCVGEFVLELTYTRRFLRGILPKGNDDSSKDRLRRAKSARLVFGGAETLAKKTRSPVLPTHLLMALLESEDAQIKTVLEKFHVDIGDFKKYVASFISKSRKLPKSP
jgi:ATP-dependent Clp protease ATP-binding subunit ClpA